MVFLPTENSRKGFILFSASRSLLNLALSYVNVISFSVFIYKTDTIINTSKTNLKIIKSRHPHNCSMHKCRKNSTHSAESAGIFRNVIVYGRDCIQNIHLDTFAIFFNLLRSSNDL